MSAEASAGRPPGPGDEARPVAPGPVAPPPGPDPEVSRGGRGLLGSKYVKLNVSGSLHYTTVQTLSKEDSLLRSLCTGDVEATVDAEGNTTVNALVLACL